MILCHYSIKPSHFVQKPKCFPEFGFIKIKLIIFFYAM